MKRVLALCIAAPLAGGSWAADAALDESVDPRQASDLPGWAIDRITPVHEMVSGWVGDTTRGIDGFFGTDDHLDVDNKSYIRLSQELDWNEGHSVDSEFRLRFKLDLPTTKKRLRLMIESDPEETRGTLAERGSNRMRGERRGSGSVIGLSHLGGKDWTRGWETRLSAGARFRLPLDPYVRADIKRRWDLGNSPWSLAWENRLSWFDSDGYFARARWDLGRPLSDTRNLRLVTNVQWREKEDKLEFSEMLAMEQLLGARSSVRYAAIMVGESGSRARINDYYLQTLYRRNVHREILYADVIPELHFHRDSRHKPRWSLTLRLEMFFAGDVVRR